MRFLRLALTAALAVPSVATAQQDAAGSIVTHARHHRLPPGALARDRPDGGDHRVHQRTHVSLMAGVAEFDLSGTGTAGIYAIRGAMPWHDNLLIEGSLAYARLEQQFGDSDFFLPELQAQLQGTWGPFSPYVGLGGGVAIDRPRGEADVESDVDFAPSFSAGVRVAVARGVGVRVDGRLHGIDANFTGTVAALSAGLTFAW